MATENLAKAFAIARGVLANVTPEDYTKPTPCASWTVRDVVNHMAEGANWFALCVNAGEAPDPDPTHGVDFAAGDLMKSFDEGVAASLAAFGAPGAQEKTVRLPFGELPGAVFMAIATDDMFVHSWDVATATGQSTDLDPELAKELLAAVQGFVSDDFRGPDGSGAPFGPQQPAPDSATAAQRLASFLGRSV